LKKLPELAFDHEEIIEYAIKSLNNDNHFITTQYNYPITKFP